MNRAIKKNLTRTRRAHSIRGHIKAGSSSSAGRQVRLSIFRSNANMYVQVIDDTVSKTVASARLSEVKATKVKQPGAQIERALELGKLVAERAVKAGVSSVVFDRGRYAYHGRVKAIADGARSGGLKF